LNSFRISCDKERREIDNLYHKRAILEAIVTDLRIVMKNMLKSNW
jgi:hypothetical protein